MSRNPPLSLFCLLDLSGVNRTRSASFSIIVRGSYMLGFNNVIVSGYEPCTDFGQH